MNTLVTKMCATQVLMLIKQCYKKHLLTKVIASTSYMHVTMQLPVCSQQELSLNFLITPQSKTGIHLVYS